MLVLLYQVPLPALGLESHVRLVVHRHDTDPNVMNGEEVSTDSHLVVAWRDEQSEVLVELTVGVTYWAGIGLGLR